MKPSYLIVMRPDGRQVRYEKNLIIFVPAGFEQFLFKITDYNLQINQFLGSF
jgi:hypothetical protein